MTGAAFNLSGVDRLGIIGDTHANPRWLNHVLDDLARRSVTHAIILGDFGYWPRNGQGRVFLAETMNTARSRNIMLGWLDGNHEDHDELQTLSLDEHRQHALGTHLVYLGRGARVVFAGQRIVVAGGAVSVDRNYRVAGNDWFAAEELTDEQVERIVADGPADVLLSHDAPFGVRTLFGPYQQDKPAWQRKTPWPTSALIASDAHQKRMARLVDGLGVHTVLHGHHHRRYTDSLVQTTVHGLDCDGTGYGTGWVVWNGTTFES